MAAMDSIKSKFDEYEITIKLLTAKLQELADENERLKSGLDAHSTLRAIYRNEAEPSGTRVKAAQAALPHETPKLNPVSQLELTAETETVIPLADLVTARRARQDDLCPESRSDFKVLNLLPAGRGHGNGSDGQDD
jgi:hypothetical protein